MTAFSAGLGMSIGATTAIVALLDTITQQKVDLNYMRKVWIFNVVAFTPVYMQAWG
jgi:predicted membrane metal-binding protein